MSMNIETRLLNTVDCRTNYMYSKSASTVRKHPTHTPRRLSPLTSSVIGAVSRTPSHFDSPTFH